MRLPEDEEIWDLYRSEVLVKKHQENRTPGWYGMRVLNLDDPGKAQKARAEFMAGTAWEEVFSRYNTNTDLPDTGVKMSLLVSDMPWDMYVTKSNRPHQPAQYQPQAVLYWKTNTIN